MSAIATEYSPVEQKLRNWEPKADIPSWFSKYRGHARDIYFDLDVPDRTDEAWHYGTPQAFSLDALDVAHDMPGFNGAKYERICGLTNRPRRITCLSMIGDNISELSSSTPLKDAGVDVMALRQALALRGDLLQQYWTKDIVHSSQNKILASHFALVDNGFFVFIPKGATAPEPIHLVMESGESGSVVAPHVIVIAEPDSKAEVFIHYLGNESESRNLQLGVVQCFVGDNADLTLAKIEHVGGRTDIFTHEVTELGQDSKFNSIAIHLGGKNLRHEAVINLDKPGASANVYGMHFLRGRQRYDFYTQQNHLAPNCHSNLLFKGAILDRARASYQGMINVAKQAQLTDAYQTNRSLVLSPKARADSSPQLEIEANDVRCSHGSSVSNVDDQMVFYLQNRGLKADDARRLIVSGFMAEIADRIPLATARDYVYNYVLERVE